APEALNHPNHIRGIATPPAPAAFRVRVWQITSWGRGPPGGRLRPERVLLGYPRPDKQITLDDTARRGGDDERTTSPDTHEDLPCRQVGIGFSTSSQLRICRRSLQCQRSSCGSPLYDR